MRFAALRRRLHKSERSSGAQVAATMSASGMALAVSLLTSMMAARLLGPQGRGAFAAILLWPTFLALVAPLGMPEALVYFVSGKSPTAGRQLGTALVIALAASVPLAVAAYLLLPYLLQADQASVLRSARIYLLILPVMALQVPLMHSLLAWQNFHAFNVLRLGGQLSWLAVLCIAWAAGVRAPDTLALWNMAAVCAVCAATAVAVSRTIPGPYRPDRQFVVPLLRFGLPSVLTAVPSQLNYRFDQMLMAAFMSASSLGLYVVAANWSNVLLPITGAIQTVSFPKIAAATSQRAKYGVAVRALQGGLAVAVAGAVALIVLTPVAFRLLYGADFAAAIPVAQVLLVAAIAAATKGLLGDAFRGLGRPTVWLWAELVSLVLSVLLLLVLLPRYGLMGAALASLCGYSTSAGIMLVRMSKASGVNVPRLLSPVAVVGEGRRAVAALHGRLRKPNSAAPVQSRDALKES